MPTPGILAFGGYIPRRRIERRVIAEANAWMKPGLSLPGKGERSVCRWDEDSVTMAVGAARDALVGRDRKDIGAVHLASTTLPFADRQNAGLVASALDLSDQVATLDVGGSLRSGTSALSAALASVGATPHRSALVVASDKRSAQPGSAQELDYGHGAASVLVGLGDTVANWLGSRAVSRDFVDHYRSAGEPFDYVLEERWVRDEGYLTIVPDTVRGLLDDAGVLPSQLDHAILPGGARVASKLAAQLGIRESALADDLASRCGHTGAAHPLVMLAAVLEQAGPHQKVLVAGFGQGADALLFETTERIVDAARSSKESSGAATGKGVGASLSRRQPETHYTRYLSDSRLLSMAWGIRAERDNRTAQSVSWRRHRELNAFVGARCEGCGAVQFPRETVCVACRLETRMSSCPLADRDGRVKSFTEDWLAHTPGPPLQYGHVALDGGASLLMEFTDFEPGGIDVGMPVSMQFRIKDIDERRGFRRYFWKAAPADGVRGTG